MSAVYFSVPGIFEGLELDSVECEPMELHCNYSARLRTGGRSNDGYDSAETITVPISRSIFIKLQQDLERANEED